VIIRWPRGVAQWIERLVFGMLGGSHP